MTYRVLVCGGRDYDDRKAVYEGLNALRAEFGTLTIIQGGARGADALARDWLYFEQASGLLIDEPADWKLHGKAAGVFRNQKMLDAHKPQLVAAFPGGRGTADMIARAERACVPVRRWVGGKWVFATERAAQ